MEMMVFILYIFNNKIQKVAIIDNEQCMHMNSCRAGICIEDKLFPKTNSLLDDGKQRLADVEEFSLKIKVSNVCKFALMTSYVNLEGMFM